MILVSLKWRIMQPNIAWWHCLDAIVYYCQSRINKTRTASNLDKFEYWFLSQKSTRKQEKNRKKTE